MLAGAENLMHCKSCKIKSVWPYLLHDSVFVLVLRTAALNASMSYELNLAPFLLQEDNCPNGSADDLWSELISFEDEHEHSSRKRSYEWRSIYKVRLQPLNL